MKLGPFAVKHSKTDQLRTTGQATLILDYDPERYQPLRQSEREQFADPMNRLMGTRTWP